MLIAFHKPYGVVSRFTPDGSAHRTLAEFGFPPGVYPVGRLDADSEGLLLLSEEPAWNQRLLDPRRGHPRVYWVQVERIPDLEALERLAQGVRIRGRATRPCRAWRLEPEPQVPERDPPIRRRQTVPTGWLGLELVEGMNRQVRHMTAAVGHPTLRLIRVQIGRFSLRGLAAGQWRALEPEERRLVAATGESRGRPLGRPVGAGSQRASSLPAGGGVEARHPHGRGKRVLGPPRT